jgi:PAS domain S-box-containing protein
MSSAPPPPSTPARPEPLRGGGEMEVLTRTLDWSHTPVGSMDTWPQSLRTVLSILLTSRHPILVFWGPELVQFYNDSYRPMLGATKHPGALGQRGRECWAEAWHVLGPQVSAVMERGESLFVEDGLLCLERNGYLEETYFTYAYSPIRDESGGVGGLFNVCTENTERVLSERRLRTLHALSTAASHQTSEQDVGRVLEQVLAAHTHDIPFALLYVAETSDAARLVGAVGVERGGPAAPVRLEARAPDTPWPWDAVLQDGQPRVVEPLPAVPGGFRAGPWPEPARSALVIPLFRPGHERPVGLWVAGISPRRALDTLYRDFLGLVATQLAQAVSNARALQEERRRAEALAELDRVKTEFFSNVSHEFRTPLALLLGPVEEGLEDAVQPLPPRQRERQELVHRNGLRLLKLVNQLLDFSRIEAGRMQAERRLTNLAALTADLASSFRSLVESAGLRLEVDCPRLPAPVWVDRPMWEKVVLNLLSNAFKFTFEGGIHVSLRAEGARAELRVRDTGIGIAPDDLPHLFERFHRVRGARSRSHEGSGIGLAMVRELVRLHDGTLDVLSTPGQGSTFRVSIPLGEPASAPKPAEDPGSTQSRSARESRPYLEEAASWLRHPAPPAPAPSGEPARAPETAQVLIVEDNADLRAYIERLLGERWSVVSVDHGEAALALARERPPQLILSDVMMPDMDGFALLRALRAEPRTSEIPVILLSARAGEEASIEALKAGADDYLVKPFSARELLSRVSARLEVARAHAATRAARTRLYSQLMRAPVAMSLVTGPDFRFELANPRYLELVGRQGQQLVGRTMREVYPELPEDAPVFQMMRRIYLSGEAFTANEYPVRLVRESGVPEDVYFLFSCQPMPGGPDGELDIMTVAVDVTSQVRARQQVEGLVAAERASRDRAEDADRRKDEFLAMLAHELRNPLAALNTALEVMGHSLQDATRVGRLRDTGLRQVGNLVRMVDDLLDVSRVTRGKVELRKTEVDFGPLVRNAIAAVRPQIDAREHTLTVSVAPDEFLLEADATRLEQVVTNLLTNAARYTPPGGAIFVGLHRELTPEGAWGVLRVRDTGRGIAPDMLERVFELFFQEGKSLDRTSGGLGIGLTLVRQLVDMHGGRVSAHSAGPGRGTEFTVRLPLLRARQLPVQESAPTRVPLGELAQRRVLVVEDSEDLRELMQEFLQDLGLEVAVAADGLEGVEQALRLLPDLAFVDVGLPGIDGYEVARRVRATPEGARLYLVALTGYGGADARREALQAGFDLHLVKPINFAELPRVLEAARKKSTPGG